MFFIAKIEADTEKDVFTMSSGGFMIAVRNNAFIESKNSNLHSLPSTYFKGLT